MDHGPCMPTSSHPPAPTRQTGIILGHQNIDSFIKKFRMGYGTRMKQRGGTGLGEIRLVKHGSKFLLGRFTANSAV